MADDDDNKFLWFLRCCLGLQYLTVIASLALQWVLFVKLNEAGLEYLNDLSLAAAILTSLGAALDVLCFFCKQSDRKVLKFCCTVIVKSPKLIAAILNVVITQNHFASNCWDLPDHDCPSVSPGERTFLDQLIIAALCVTGVAALLTFCIAIGICIKGRPSEYRIMKCED